MGGGGGVLIGESKWAEEKVYRSLLAAGLTAYSIKEFFTADSSEAAIKLERRQWTGVFSSILWAVNHHVVVAQEEKAHFNQEIERLRQELAEAETPGWVKTLKSIEVDDGPEKPQAKPWSKAQKQYAAFLRQQAQVCRTLEADPQHRFHQLKSEALATFNNQQYREALKLATEALALYALDKELLRIQLQARRIRAEPMGWVAAVVLLLFALLYLFRNRLSAYLDLPGWLFICLLLVLFLFAVYLGLRWVDRRL